MTFFCYILIFSSIRAQIQILLTLHFHYVLNFIIFDKIDVTFYFERYYINRTIQNFFVFSILIFKL